MDALPNAATVSEPRRRTRAETLAEALSNEIIAGEISPGTPLDEVELAQRFGVSRTPVREAIRQLAAAGLVQTRPHKGAVVALPSLRRLNEMFEAMSELEGLCAGLSAQNMTSAERTALCELHERMHGFAEQDDRETYQKLNTEFHRTIYAGTHNGYLVELTEQTRNRLAPFRLAQFHSEGRLSESHEEHLRVLVAILARDRAGAALAMREHIGIVQNVYVNMKRS